jgi:hypothetical protein
MRHDGEGAEVVKALNNSRKGGGGGYAQPACLKYSGKLTADGRASRKN